MGDRTFDFTIESLPDPIILHIFSFTDTSTLGVLCRVNNRLRKLASDHTLWQTVDLSSVCTNLNTFWKLLRTHLSPSLRSLSIRGHAKKYMGSPKWKTESLSSALLKQLQDKCPNLSHLTLKEAYVTSRVTINDFPKSITDLVIRDCDFACHADFFQANSPEVLPQLRSLDISYCISFPGTVLNQISKWKDLKSLKLQNCFRIKDDNVHFLCGEVLSLQELDLRGTNVGDISLQIIGSHQKELQKLWIGSGGCHCKITNQGVYGLAGLKNKLELLDVSGSSITNTGFEYIMKTYKKLNELNIEHCELKMDVIELGKQYLPKCNVIFKT